MYWGDFETKAIIQSAKINFEKNIITIDSKETSNFDAYSITLNSDNGFNFKGKYGSVITSNLSEKIAGSLFMKLYKKEDKFLLVGKWIEEGDRILCVIELNG